ncbi:hypothetical protein [Solimonas sp. SE-A11]|uniref:hypothetical protein n=1 Tax=Solimonas sp. SE-A11 TaxID=3054954 RepID=UPI00259CE388|nr:hypothetical protein [Solimonas sp. SE-A11]MDM4769056.1 hypothetical protein [Solimonas sp. SE-A11]
MATLALLGLDLTIAAGGSVDSPYPGVTARFTLDAAATRLTIQLNGNSGAVRFTGVQIHLACSIQDGRVVFRDAPNVASTGEVTLTIGGRFVTATAEGAVVDRGVLFFRHPATLAQELAQSTGNPLGAAFSFERLQYWQRSLLCCDIEKNTAELLADDTRPRALLRDQFGGTQTSPRVDQFLHLRGARLEAAEVALLFDPVHGALYLNADILDPTVALDDKENSLLFQHIIAEGRVEADFASTASGWVITQWWVAPQAKDFILGVPALRDEHGHPLALRVPGRVPLSLRIGGRKAERNGRLNQAVVLGKRDAIFECEVVLVAIDPIATYGLTRAPKPLGNDRIVSAPYWVHDGRALVVGTRPREILGWSANGAVRTGERTALACTLKLNPVRPQASDLLFVEAGVAFNTKGMTLCAELPERATFAFDGGEAPPMRRYSAEGLGRSATLPLCDLNWTFAELAGPRQDADLQPLSHTAQSWPTNLNKQLIDSFGAASLGRYAHSEGHRAVAPTQPFARLIGVPPATTMGMMGRMAQAFAPAETVLRRPTSSLVGFAGGLATSSTAALFGGPRSAAAIGDAVQKLDHARGTLGLQIESFFRFWAGINLPGGLISDPSPARRALRAYLVGEPIALGNPEDWGWDELLMASTRLSQASELLGRNPPRVLGFDEYAETLSTSLPDEVVELLDPAGDDGPVSCIFQYAYAPPSIDVLKRALAAVWSSETAPVLREHLPVLRQVIDSGLKQAVNDFFAGAGKPAGLIAELLQGLSPLVEQVELLWRDHQQLDPDISALFDDFNARYGALFSPEVYSALLADPVDAEALLQALRALGMPLISLADLSFEPPDYLMLSRRTRSAGVAGDTESLHPVDRIAALWNHRLDFCSLGGGKAWDMFLDDETTVVVKLGGDRGLAAVLAEAHKAYATPGCDDPFGLANGIQTSDPVGAFCAQLASELLRPEWRGVLIINPTVDLERDPVLSTLCGLPHIAARYAAVGGQTPAALQGIDLDVWGRIERRAEREGWAEAKGDSLKGPPEWGKADVGWALSKFEATIKNTTILSGEIAFLLEVRELFGRTSDWPLITVSGVLRPADAPTAGAARDFTFGASFDTPLKLNVDVAFIEDLFLRGVRVGSHDGDTTLNIDADLKCRKWSLGGFDFELPDAPVRLSDFRVRMPAVSGGLSIPMGIRRALGFDLGAIRFPVVGERQFRIAGLEIKPVGVGLLRDSGAQILKRLKSETMSIVDPEVTDQDRYAYPYLDTRISFGSGPELGGGGQLALVARTGVPVSDPGTKFHAPGLGVASLEGRNLKLSLFRLLTIEAEEVSVEVLPLREPTLVAGEFEFTESANGQSRSGEIMPFSFKDDGVAIATADARVGVINVKNFNLKLLSWSLFDDDDERQLILAQKTEQGGGRGMLAWYSSGEKEPSGAFFKLHWLLIARNFNPGHGVLNALLSPSHGGDVPAERKAIAGIITRNPNAQLNASIGKDDPWLFGIRFDLGELFKPCVLVLHDGHYYGIRLGGLVPKLLTGEEELNFAYIPGSEPALDRFRTTFRCAAFDLLAEMRSGVMALEWSPCWDFLIDCGQPWRGPEGYAWERSFSIPVGTYEAKFGFFIERRTSLAPPPTLPGEQGKFVTFSAGAGFYLGYRFELSAGIAWVRAGIGVFGVMIGSATLKLPVGADPLNPLALLKGSLAQLQVVGVIGIYAYGEGGVEVWILSARFRVSAQAFVEVTLTYVPSGRSMIAWDATLSAHYSASVRVGSGWFSWTFRVSGAVQMSISGRAAFG